MKAALRMCSRLLLPPPLPLPPPLALAVRPPLTFPTPAIHPRYGQLEDLWVSRAPTGPDCFAVATFASAAAAQRAQAALAGQVLPALTEKMLKVREWTQQPERASQAATWRRDAPAAPQQRWADAVDELPLPQPLPQRRTFGSGWEAAMAAAEEEEEEEEEYDEEDEEEDEWGELGVCMVPCCFLTQGGRAAGGKRQALAAGWSSLEQGLVPLAATEFAFSQLLS